MEVDKNGHCGKSQILSHGGRGWQLQPSGLQEQSRKMKPKILIALWKFRKTPLITDIQECNITPPESEVSDETKPKAIQFKLTVFFLCAISFVASMDVVIVGACLVLIVKDIGATSN